MNISVGQDGNDTTQLQSKYIIYDILNNQVCCMPFISTDKAKKVFMSTQSPENIALAMMYSIIVNGDKCINKVLDDTFLILNQQQQQPQQPVEGYQAIPDDIPPLVDIEWC